MEYHFPDNTVSSSVTYMRTREGPNHFRVYYKNAAVIQNDKKVGAVFGVAVYSSVNKIRDWCYEMVKEYGSDIDEDNQEYKNYIAKHGFGPKVHPEPNDMTKIVAIRDYTV